MTSKYPEWLIQRVARVIVSNYEDFPDPYDLSDSSELSGWRDEIIADAERTAEAVLDALNFRRKTSHGLVVAGSGLVYQAATLDPWNPDSPKLPALESWCAHTEWIEVEL